MNPTFARQIAGLLGIAAVALGAFGAHGLKMHLTATGMLESWKTGALYHLAHTLVLLVLALQPRVDRATFWTFVAGIFCFSGSLYLLPFVHIPGLVFVTPLGGFVLLAAWAMLAFRRQG